MQPNVKLTIPGCDSATEFAQMVNYNSTPTLAHESGVSLEVVQEDK
ncbi:MAG: hypothetical protein V7L20_31830 [Nostoc sp.]